MFLAVTFPLTDSMFLVSIRNAAPSEQNSLLFKRLKINEISYHILFRHWSHTSNEYICHHIERSNCNTVTQHKRWEILHLCVTYIAVY